MAQEKPIPVDVRTAKTWLRGHLATLRQSIPRAKQTEWSRAISKRVICSPQFKTSKNIALYLGFGSEVLTDDIVKASWDLKKNVLIPITLLGFHRPYFALLNPGDPLSQTRFGPLEPHGKKAPFDFNKVELVIVPGLCFDSRGFRLGYGGGVYDRLLSRTPQAAHMGLQFSLLRLKNLPHAPHDKRVQSVVTERGILFPIDKSIRS